MALLLMVGVFFILIVMPAAITVFIWKTLFVTSRFDNPDYQELGVNGRLKTILSAYLIIFFILCLSFTLDQHFGLLFGGSDSFSKAVICYLITISVWIALPFIARALADKAQRKSEYFHIKSIFIYFILFFPPIYIIRILTKALSGLGHGRPFRIKGTPVVSKVSNSSKWIGRDIKICVDLDLESRRALEAVWLDSASKEHASVPAFSKLSLQLIAIGAPPELIAKVFTAASQEVTHAKLCFSVAASVSGRPWSPNAMPQVLEVKSGSESLERLILECFVDGCLMEALSAAHARASSELAEEADVKHVFSVIAKDESFHAELSWEILKFLLTKDSSVSQRVILSEFRLIKSRSAPEFYPAEICKLIEKADRESMRRFGILSKDKANEIWLHTLQGIEYQLTQMASSRN